MFTKIDYTLAHKTNDNKCQRIEIQSTIISGHGGIQLEIIV